MGRIHLGTSGFVYKHWRNVFYPPKLPSSQWLGFYSQVFTTVEMNTTFYRLPKAAAVKRWREEVPNSFVFACKGSRFLTHMKRLTDTGLGLRRFYTPLRQLGTTFRVVLWQLPPNWKTADLTRLDHFLASQPPGPRQVVEFRHESWYVDEVCDVLDRHGAAFCEHDLVPKAPPRITGGFRYLRFHGTTGKYQGRYGKRALRPFARSLAQFRSSGDAFVYFNNDLQGHALADALDLADLLELPTPTKRLPAGTPLIT